MIYNVTKFRHYLLGQKFSFHVDHLALLYLVCKASLIGKLAQWTLLLQEFEFEIYHRPGVPDYLSRLESGAAGDGVRDEFLDAQLFRVIAENMVDETVADEDKWLTNIHHFLSSGLPPKDLNRDERKRLVVKSRHFCLLQDTLFHKGADGIWRRAVQIDEKDAIL